MAGTLYDVLELSPKASPDSIRAAYERLSEKYDPESPKNQGKPEIRLQHTSIKDAFFRLGDPAKRAQYDLTLLNKKAAAYVEVLPPFWTLGKVLILSLVVITCVGLYVRDQRQQKVIAAQKAIAEEKRKEAEALAIAERENAQAEAARMMRERNEAARAQQEYNQFRQDAARLDRTQAQRAQAERQQDMYDRQRNSQAQREEQMRQSQAQREQQASEANSRRQIAEEKRRLQEIENSRGRVVVLPR